MDCSRYRESLHNISEADDNKSKHSLQNRWHWQIVVTRKNSFNINLEINISRDKSHSRIKTIEKCIRGLPHTRALLSMFQRNYAEHWMEFDQILARNRAKMLKW